MSAVVKGYENTQQGTLNLTLSQIEWNKHKKKETRKKRKYLVNLWLKILNISWWMFLT